MVDLHYIWALGHFVVLTSSVRIFYAYTIGLFGKSFPGFWYRTSYAGTLLSYLIVIYKTLGIPELTGAWAQRALSDDNAQYGLLALYWALTRPVYLSTVPFATFSLFHVLTFLKTNILPKIFRNPPPANAPATARATVSPAGEKYQSIINNWVKTNFNPAMRFVSYSELVIFAWSIVRAVTRQGSFLAPVFLAHFLRLRFASSAFTRDAVHNVSGRIDGLVAGQAPAVQNVWSRAKGLIVGWASTIMPINQYQQGAAAGTGSGAGAGQTTGNATGVNAAGAGGNARARTNAAR